MGRKKRKIQKKDDFKSKRFSPGECSKGRPDDMTIMHESSQSSAQSISIKNTVQSSAVGKEAAFFRTRKHTLEVGNINDKLPNIVLLQIFSHFSLAEKLDYMNVCKYWADLLKRNLSLNKEIIVTAEANALQAKERDRYILSRSGFRKALTFCPSLAVLDLTAVKEFDVKHLKFVPTLTASCKELTVLKLPATTFTVTESKKLAKGLRQLEQLEASHCNFTDRFLSTLFGSCKQLRILDVTQNTGITSKPFKNAPATLQKLNVNGCFEISDNMLDMLIDTCSDSLTHLSLAFDGESSNRFKNMVAMTKLINLQYLDISEHVSWECPGPNNEHGNPISVFAMLSKLNKLRVLNLADSACIHDADIVDILGGCTQLEELNISGDFLCVTSEGFQRLKDARNLKILNVSYQENIDDDCLEAFAHLPHLQKLVAMGCASITNSGLSFLALLSSSLRELDISGCEELEGDVSVLGQFRDNSKNRAGVLVIYFGGTNLAEEFSALEAEDVAVYSDPDSAKLELYPDVNHSRVDDNDDFDWLDGNDSFDDDGSDLGFDSTDSDNFDFMDEFIGDWSDDWSD